MEQMIARPVSDVAGILGLVALAAAAVAIAVGSWVAWRHPADTGDNSASGHLPKVWKLVRALVVLGVVLLVIWVGPAADYIGPAPMYGWRF